jgi:hypothetical protein
VTPVREALDKTLSGLHWMLFLQLEQNPVADDGVAEHATYAYALRMVETAQKELGVWPVDKTSRWVGYVQGIMAVRGLLDVQAERDRTRPFFHEAYRAEGIALPPSRDLGKPNA